MQEPLGVGPILRAEHKIVGITDDNHIALRHFLAPDLDRPREMTTHVRDH